MFEEVPRERHGLTRLLPVRRIVLGPFVLGGGMLLVALGGSVAVAAAATVFTASAFSSSGDVPPRTQQLPVPTASHPAAPVPHAPHRPARPATTPMSAGAGRSSSAPGAAISRPGSGVVAPAPANAAPAHSPAGSPAQSPAGPSVPASPTGAVSSPAPSSSGPLGNAVIHVSGYDRATGRLFYQFATVVPQTAGAAGYVISGPRTFTAALAPSAAITSAGTLCPPAGSRCTPDQLIAAADSGFFAEAAIDVTGTLRALVEVGDQVAGVERAPVPSAAPTPPGGHSARRGAGSPQPTASPAASS